MELFLAYLLIINATALLLMLADKEKARRHRWRIPEATLLGTALLGGSLGAWLGMKLGRHKTRHAKFALGLPILLLVHFVCLAFALGAWYWHQTGGSA